VINISGGRPHPPATAVNGGIRNVGTANLTKSMANALGPYGINVNAIYPGQTITEATLERYGEQAQREGTTVEALHKAADERTLLKHVVTATDIGTSWRCCVRRSPSACTAKPSPSTAATAPTCTTEIGPPKRTGTPVTAGVPVAVAAAARALYVVVRAT